MNSVLYHGLVEHERYHPTTHRLRYPLLIYALDLDELERLERGMPLFGYNRRRLVSLRDLDYLEPTPEPIRRKLIRRLAPLVGTAAIARVVLVTTPRFLGHIFNPVSFFYCFDAEGALLGVAAEVNNTFGEKHLYLLTAPTSPPGCFPARYETDKVFHVSPFNTLEGRYRFAFGDIRRELEIRIELHRETRLILTARLWGVAPRPLTPSRHLAAFLRHPLLPHLSIPRIYQEAFKLRFRRGLAYHDKPVARSPMTIRRLPPTPLQRRCMGLILRYLAAADSGALEFRLPDGSSRRFGGGGDLPAVVLRINDHRFFSRLVLEADIGLGEAYMHGEWDCDDLPGAIAFFIQNRPRLRDGQFKESLLARSIEVLRYLRRANTLAGSLRNIRRHYDLSNAFFQTFLDPSMAYSCAIFTHPGESLEEAQRRKYDTIIAKARLRAEDHVLEIGCGWGGFAIHAVRTTGCRLTGITISREQYRLACERVAAAGLQDRIRILFRDYRAMAGHFDKIVSIEMLEAVGHSYFGLFFRQLERLLDPRGIVVLQTITIPDQRYESYRREHDWIRKHIFQGGLIPSLTVLTRTMTRHSGLVVEHMENIGNHSATTLAHWRRRFEADPQTVAQLGFDRVFRRKWSYYLASCEAGFRTRVLGDLQLVLTREGNPLLADS